MKYSDNKLIVFLKSFSIQELNEFEKFLNSPFFKQTRDTIPLFKILKKYHPDFSSDKFTETEVFNELYPSLNYSDKKPNDNFRKLSSVLMKSIEEFIYFYDIKNDNLLKNRTIMKRLLQSQLTKYYEQYMQASVSELQKNESDTAQDFLENFYLEKLNTRYYSNIVDFKNLFIQSEKSVENISIYFLIDLFRTAKSNFLAGFNRNFKSGNNTVDRLLETLDMEKILKIFENTPKFVHLYFNYYTYKCLIDKNGNDLYAKVKKLFFEKKSDLTRYEKCLFYSDLLNVALFKNDTGLTEFRKEVFPIMKSCIEDRAYKISDTDVMQIDFYRNVILFANLNKEFDWMKDFINDYSHELKAEYRDNMKLYSLALLNYGTGDFETSLEYISRVKYDLEHLKVDVKILMLKIYHNLNLREQANSLIDTFKHFIKNSKSMPPVLKEGYNNFLNYYLLISKLKPDNIKNEKEIIRSQINKEKYVNLKSWLNEIINNI